MLNGLRQRFPDCNAFSVANGRGQSFIGASPERLLRVEDGVVLTEALAGSAARGATASEDAALGSRLLRSEKDLREQRIVLDSIVQRLAPLGLELRYSARPAPEAPLERAAPAHAARGAPAARRARSSTCWSGCTRRPAVGGTPREVAVPLIAGLEAFPRGLYGGALGWIDSRGGGEFIVGLRSALIDGAAGPDVRRRRDRRRLVARSGSSRRPSSSSRRCRTRSWEPRAMRSSPSQPPALDFRNANCLWGSVLVETLVRCGVRRAVVSPGSRSTPLAFAFARHPGIEAIPVLDERSAAFFALGMAKQDLRPVALLCTSGTAGANYFPAVIEAQEAGVPLLVITADRPPEMRACASGQTIDQQRLYGGHVELLPRARRAGG